MKKMTLKAARTNAGLSQKEAAEILGICDQTLSSYERGVSYPDVPLIEKLETLYGVSYADIRWRIGD